MACNANVDFPCCHGIWRKSWKLRSELGVLILVTLSISWTLIAIHTWSFQDACLRNPHRKIFIPGIPIIYAITPTYNRSVQKADLTRLSHTLRHVPNLHWIIVEDGNYKTRLVSNLLKSSGLSYTHLNASTPPNWKLTHHKFGRKKGVVQRNTGLMWLRRKFRGEAEVPNGIVYFADDDNTYGLEVFEEMRNIKKVGVWPVGFVGGLKVERPNVTDGNVTGWIVKYNSNRPFAIDMAGFAINLAHFLSRPKASFSFEVREGYQESEILKYMVNSLDELEPKADNCTKVYVWHTRTSPPYLGREVVNHPSDLNIEV